MTRQIYNFPGYTVTDTGRVFGRKGKEMKQLLTKEGYIAVQLWRDNKSCRRFAHVLVLEAFIGLRPENYVAAHWDGIRTNNARANLRWATRKENEADKLRHGTRARGEDAPTAKLKNQEVRCILETLAAGETQDKIAARHGVNRRTISKINRGIRWAHMPKIRPILDYSTHKCTVGKPFRWSLICTECGKMMPRAAVAA